MMRILLSKAPISAINDFGEAIYRDYLGFLYTPRVRSTPNLAVKTNATWAMDNDCFKTFDEQAFVKALHVAADFLGCRFVSAPDRVSDPIETLARFERWEPVIHALGLPVALVAQDGLENLAIPWDRFEAFFIGGSTRWKLGNEAARLVQTAHSHGKWIHVGRVNSNRRLQYALAIQADSVDGTGYSRFSRSTVPAALEKLKCHSLPLLKGFVF